MREFDNQNLTQVVYETLLNYKTLFQNIYPSSQNPCLRMQYDCSENHHVDLLPQLQDENLLLSCILLNFPRTPDKHAFLPCPPARSGSSTHRGRDRPPRTCPAPAKFIMKVINTEINSILKLN